MYDMVGPLVNIGLFICGGFYTFERRYPTPADIGMQAENTKSENDTTNKEPYVIVCNHLSMLDILFFLSEFNIVCFLARVRKL